MHDEYKILAVIASALGGSCRQLENLSSLHPLKRYYAVSEEGRHERLAIAIDGIKTGQQRS